MQKKKTAQNNRYKARGINTLQEIYDAIYNTTIMILIFKHTNNTLNNYQS